MNIEKALKLQIGDVVRYPADRGSPAGYGRITHVNPKIYKTIKNEEYIWVSVRMFGHASVWPSNRLG